MRWDRGQPDDQYDEETSITGQARHCAIVQVCALEFERPVAEEVLECKPSADCVVLSTRSES